MGFVGVTLVCTVLVYMMEKNILSAALCKSLAPSYFLMMLGLGHSSSSGFLNAVTAFSEEGGVGLFKPLAKALKLNQCCVSQQTI